MGGISPYLIFIIALLFVIGVAGAAQRRRERAAYIKHLREDFGKVPQEPVSRRRMEHIPGYFLHHKKEGQIDDITWNDLEMDRVYRFINHCCSGAGQEYLYYLLRTPALHPDENVFSQKQIAWYDSHDEERLSMQMALSVLDTADRYPYSMYEYLDLMERAVPESNILHYFSIAVPAVCFALMFVNVPLGLVLLIVSLGVNMVTYYRVKGKIDPYLSVFRFILMMLHCADLVEKESSPEFAGSLSELGSHVKAMDSFRRGSGILMGTGGGNISNNPVDLILDYIRILFHIDLIQFNRMLRLAKGRYADLDAVFRILGQIDTCISIASFRRSLPYYCGPELREEKKPSFSAQQMYHILIEHPVPNSLLTDRPILLTGSNASGKSTFLKAAALCALLSQTLGTAPAREYSASYFRIFTSMALRDSLIKGESYFIVEIRSLKRILDAAEDTDAPPVLSCIDEVLRGTNTTERIAASAQILQCFYERSALSVAATHDLELADLLDGPYRNFHFGETIEKGDVAFSYKLMPGKATTTNAIRLLKMLGYDEDIVEKAKERADRFEKTGVWS